MKTISQCLIDFVDHLEKAGIASPKRQVEEIIADLLKMRRSDLYWEKQRQLTAEEQGGCEQLMLRRAKREPIQYLRGKIEFLELTLSVTPSVLIPRQETEILADKISKELSGQTGSLWDICCGSGCIGLSLKKRCPQLNVILSDLSPEALKISAENAKYNALDVELRQGDLTAPFYGEKAQFVVCNPPYVSESEWATLDPEVRCYEPHLALVAGPTGLEFYQRLAADLPPHLASKAKLWFEIGHGQGEAIRAIFSDPFWKVIFLECDYAGKERFFSVETE